MIAPVPVHCFSIIFSTLYNTFPHNQIKEKFLDLIEGVYNKVYKNEGTLYLTACNDTIALFTSTYHRGYKLWSCHNVYDALSDLLDNTYIRFGNKLYTVRQIVGNLIYIKAYWNQNLMVI